MTSTSPLGVIYCESEYESAEQSIEDFLGMVTNLFLWQWDEAISEAIDPDKMMAAAYDEETSALWVGPMEGHFRIFWLSCDGECVNGIRPGRN